MNKSGPVLFSLLVLFFSSLALSIYGGIESFSRKYPSQEGDRIAVPVCQTISSNTSVSQFSTVSTSLVNATLLCPNMDVVSSWVNDLNASTSKVTFTSIVPKSYFGKELQNKKWFPVVSYTDNATLDYTFVVKALNGTVVAIATTFVSTDRKGGSTSRPSTSRPSTSKPTTSKPTTSKPTTSKPSKPSTTRPTTTRPSTFSSTSSSKKTTTSKPAKVSTSTSKRRYSSSPPIYTSFGRRGYAATPQTNVVSILNPFSRPRYLTYYMTLWWALYYNSPSYQSTYTHTPTTTSTPQIIPVIPSNVTFNFTAVSMPIPYLSFDPNTGNMITPSFVTSSLLDTFPLQQYGVATALARDECNKFSFVPSTIREESFIIEFTATNIRWNGGLVYNSSFSLMMGVSTPNIPDATSLDSIDLQLSFATDYRNSRKGFKALFGTSFVVMVLSIVAIPFVVRYYLMNNIEPQANFG